MEIMETNRIIIADDDGLFRLGFEELVSARPDFKIINIYSDGGSSWNFIGSIDCDILVLDINMPGVNGLQILEKVRVVQPEIKVLILSVMPEEVYALRAYKLGANGYLRKDTQFDQILQAIDIILNGELFITPELSRKFAVAYLENSKEIQNKNVLSSREYEILTRIAKGKTTTEIADDLFISSRTVTSHKKNILEKLKLKNTVELIEYAIKNNII